MDAFETNTAVATMRELPWRSSLNYGALGINALFSFSALVQFCRECWEDGWAAALLSFIGLQ